MIKFWIDRRAEKSTLRLPGRGLNHVDKIPRERDRN